MLHTQYNTKAVNVALKRVCGLGLTHQMTIPIAGDEPAGHIHYDTRNQ